MWYFYECVIILIIRHIINNVDIYAEFHNSVKVQMSLTYKAQSRGFENFWWYLEITKSHPIQNTVIS